MPLKRLNKDVNLTPCYRRLIIPLIYYLTDEELQKCLINDNTICPDKVINFYNLLSKHNKYSYDSDAHTECTCGVSIKDVYYIQKINDNNIILPIGCICIKRFDRFHNQYQEFDRLYWNKDKYCKHCGKGDLKGWRIGKVHKKCYREYMKSR